MDVNETRTGFAFDRPDLTNNRYYDNWGLILTPDELRYLVTFGVSLVSKEESQTFTDDNLQYYIDNAIGQLEAFLHIDIYPRVIRYTDSLDTVTGDAIPRTGIENDRNQVREMGYPYRDTFAENYLYTKLNRRPLQKILNAKLVDPLQNTLLDIYSWRKEEPGLEATVYFFPQSGTVFFAIPFYNPFLGKVYYPYKDFPDPIKIDYLTGWDRADKVPRDLVEVARKLAGIMLLADFGDGRTAALASGSANLNSISESFSTTMSATSAMYGARILQWQKEIKEWKKNNYNRYSRSVIGAFG